MAATLLTVLRITRLFAALGEDLGWNHSYRERDPERDDEIVEVPEDRYRIWYQVYGTEGVPDHDCGESPRIPWHPRVLVGQIQRVDFDLEPQRPPLESPDRTHRTWLGSTEDIFIGSSRRATTRVPLSRRSPDEKRRNGVGPPQAEERVRAEPGM